MGHIIKAGWSYVKMADIPDVNEVIKELTYVPRMMAEEKGIITDFFYTTIRGENYIAMPRSYTSKKFPNFSQTDLTVDTMGMMHRRLPDPNHPSVKDPIKQKLFMEQLLRAMQTEQNFIATAPTGSGKTVCFLWAAAKYGRRTLITVHLERLVDQWTEEIITHLGLREDEIGIIKQDRCEFDKPISIALIHSLAARDYPKELYSAFGLIGGDEIHRTGTKHFATALPKFKAATRMGLSATTERRDGWDIAYKNHLGQVTVTSTAEALHALIYVQNYTGATEIKSANHGARMMLLSWDKARNNMMAATIYQLYKWDRQILVVAAGIEHLQKVMALVVKLGIPQEKVGLFAAQRKEITWPTVEGKRTKKVKSIKLKKEELDYVKNNSQVIFSTYGYMTEGIDIPRLDAGVDLTPVSTAEQLIGRIRRPYPNKPRPLWVTTKDNHCKALTRYFAGRLKDYNKTNCEVRYDQSPKEQNHSTTAKNTLWK